MSKAVIKRRRVQPVDRVAHDLYLSIRGGRMFMATAIKRLQRCFEANGIRMSPNAVEVWFRTEYLQDPLTGKNVLPLN